MLVYFLLAVIAFLLNKLDFYRIASHEFSVKKRKITRLKNLVSTQYTGIAKICWVCLCMLSKALYLSFLQWVNKSVVRISPNMYEVSYVINGVVYKFHVKVKKGPNSNIVIQASDENDEDVTGEFLTYLGPMDNFHGNLYTPKHFGVKTITLNMASGEDRSFEEDEHITL